MLLISVKVYFYSSRVTTCQFVLLFSNRTIIMWKVGVEYKNKKDNENDRLQSFLSWIVGKYLVLHRLFQVMKKIKLSSYNIRLSIICCESYRP